jgi:ribonuclease HI
MPIRLTSMAKVAQFPRFDWVLRFDGGSRGNPGEAGCGAVIYANSKSTLKEVWCGYFYMGNSLTNNQAEYGGLIEGLKQCVTMKLKSLEIQGDSQLIIRQVQGVYQCRNEKLKPLYQKVHKLLAKFSSISFMHVRRAENARADALANTAMDKESSFSYYTNFTEYEALLKSTVESGPVSMDQAAPARVRKPRTKKVSGTESTGVNDSTGVVALVATSADVDAGAPTKAVRKPRDKKVTEVGATITAESTASAIAASSVIVEASVEVSEEGDVKAKKPRATRAKKVTDSAVVEGLVSSVVELPGL